MEKSAAIKALRKKKGITQQDLANELGLAVSSVARYEAGKPPDIRILVRLAIMAEEVGEHALATVFNDGIISNLGMDARNSLLAFRRIRTAMDTVGKVLEQSKEQGVRDLLSKALVDLNFALNRLRETNVFTKSQSEDE